MITIQKFRPEDQNQAYALDVYETQRPFIAGPVATMVENRQNGEHLQLIWFNQKIAVFFILDTQYAQRYTFAKEGMLGVRALLIDRAFQGQKIGQKMLQALPEYARTHFPQFNRLGLTVNCRNSTAYRCYLKGGFRDSGELYRGGPVGPQHIMWVSTQTN